MTGSAAKADLHLYLQAGRDALLWKLEGLGEYDLRRPMTPTGANLLGLVKYVAGCELGYFGAVFGRPSSEPQPWFDEGGFAPALRPAEQALDRVVAAIEKAGYRPRPGRRGLGRLSTPPP